MARSTGKWRVVAGAFLLALGGAGVGYVYLHARQAQQAADPERARAAGQPIPVRTALVSESEIEQVIGATCLTLPSQSVVVQLGPSKALNANGPVTNFVLKALHVHEGDVVKKGQLLCELDDTQFRKYVRQQEAAFAAAQAQLDQAREDIKYNEQLRELDMASARSEMRYRIEDLDNNKKKLDVVRELYERNRSSTLFDLYTAISQYLSASYLRTEADRRVQRVNKSIKVGTLRDHAEEAKALGLFETAKFDLEAARHDLARFRVTSPLDGVVDLRGRSEPVPNEIIGVGSPLLQVSRLDPVFARLDFPQERIDDLAVGLTAEVVLDSFPKETFTGKVVRVSPQANPQLRTVPVTVEIANPGNRIKAGVTGFARLRVAKKTLTLPATAVLERGSRSMVFRVEAGRARIRPVRTGFPVDAGVVEIKEGLAAGDEVVLYHNFYESWGKLTTRDGYLQDNDRVDADWRRWARRD